MKTLETYLVEHPFLKGMDQKHIELLVGCAKNVRYNPGEYLFREGDEADLFFFIREGQLALEAFRLNKGSITIYTLGDNDVLGWSWLVAPHIRHFDCRALELTRAIALDGNCLRGKCEKDHELGYALLNRFVKLMEDEIMALRLQLMDIYDAPIK